MNGVVPIHCNEYNYTYLFILHHLLPSVLCFTVNTQKVSDTPVMILSFQTVTTIANILTHFVASSININTMHGNTCTRAECLFGMNVVLLNHHDDDDHSYSFKLCHVLTSILCRSMTMTEHKVSDTPVKMCCFQTIMTIATILAHCVAFIYSHQCYA